MSEKTTVQGFSFSGLPKPSQFDHMLLVVTVVGSLALVVWRFYVWWKLRHIAGPFLASLTNFTRMRWVTTKRAHLIHQQLHNKYGDVVRMGPNMVSIGNPSAISAIYPMRQGFVKVYVQ